MTTDFKAIYNEFMEELENTTMTSEEVGVVLAKLAHCYGEVVEELKTSQKMANRKFLELVNSVTPDGKTIAVNKAEAMFGATQEWEKMDSDKKDLAVLDKQISCLQTLQYGLQKDFGNQKMM